VHFAQVSNLQTVRFIQNSATEKEGFMAIKVLIKRIVPEHKTKSLLPILRQLRNSAMNQPGYITGETLRGADNPTEYLVIGTWQSLEDWKRWAGSRDRIELQEQIDALLGEKTEYKAYYYG
jgi:heme-degrading monooxygenase HmoA